MNEFFSENIHVRKVVASEASAGLDSLKCLFVLLNVVKITNLFIALSRSSVRFACTEASSHGKNCKQFVHPRKYSHENSLDTRGALRAPPCIEGVFMGIFARVHGLLQMLP